MCHICNITDLSQGGVVFQKQLQKHVISGPFGLFYMPHNIPIRRNWSGFLWVNIISGFILPDSLLHFIVKKNYVCCKMFVVTL